MRQNATLDKRILWTIRFCAIALFGVFIWSLVQNLMGLLSLDKRLIDAREENSILKQELKDLQALSQDYRENKYLEYDIRTKLGLVKENEAIAIIPEIYFQKESTRSDVSKRVLPPVISDPVWKQWYNLLL